MKRKNPTLPAAILVLCFLMIWQGAAMRMDKAYILPSPLQILKRLWELREPLFKAHLPATMQVVGIGLLISLVLGGLPITGGAKVRFSNIIVGTLMYAVLNSGLAILGYDPQTQQLIKGVIFLIFVALTIDRKALKVIK